MLDRYYCWRLAGLIVCLLWNVVAVTLAWIKGEGGCFTTYYSSFKLTTIDKPIIAFILFPCCRSNNLVSCYNILHIGCSRSLCILVSSTLSCNEVPTRLPSFPLFIFLTLSKFCMNLIYFYFF